MELKKTLITVIGVIITVIILFSFVGGSASTVINASNSVLYPNDCDATDDSAGAPYYFNVSDGDCYNSSTASQGTAELDRLPLSALFASNGVILIILMAMLLIGITVYILKRVRL